MQSPAHVARPPDIPLLKGWPRRVRSAVIHTISLARTSVTHTRSWAANHYNARIRLKEQNERLHNEVLLLREETRIKNSRMEQIPAHRRPHYPPIQRLAILELRAARGWSQAQTVAHFLVTPLTISSWNRRLDDEGAESLVQTPAPVNTFPEFVGYFVRRLKALCPSMGKTRIANVLCRAGLHLGSTTVRRMLRETDRPTRPTPAHSTTPGRVVTAKRPDHVWHADLTTVPTTLGFWVPWLPCSLPPIWPFCWFVAVVVDHFSRRVMGVAVFKKEPTSKAIRAFLVTACRWVPHGTRTRKGWHQALGWCKFRSVAKADNSENDLIEKIRALPPEKVAEVEDFVDFLRSRSDDGRLAEAAARASEAAFGRVWDNPADADYDRL